MADRFSIESTVENVVYLDNDERPCSIILNDGYSKHGIPSNTYFDSGKIKICEFAEKCMDSGVSVRLYGRKYPSNQYITYGIEYGGKKYKHRYF